MKSEREACKKIILPPSVARVYMYRHGKCLPQSSGSYISKPLMQSNNSKAMSLMEIPFLLENDF